MIQPSASTTHLPTFVPACRLASSSCLAMSFSRGTLISGGLAQLRRSDDDRLIVRPGMTVNGNEAPVQIVLGGRSPFPEPCFLKVLLEASVSIVGLQQSVSLYDYFLERWIPVNSRDATLEDSQIVVNVGDRGHYFEPGTGAIQARLSFRPVGPLQTYLWVAGSNQFQWLIAQ